MQQVDRSIDRLVWYAGWADKLSQVLGTVNPVGASYFDFSIPEPTGVVGIVAPESSSLLGLVSRLAPVVVGGNTAVVLTSESKPLPAITLCRDPGHERRARRCHQHHLGPACRAGAVAGAHQDVNGIDAYGVPATLRVALERAAIENLKRVARPPRASADPIDWLDDTRAQRPEWIAAFLEIKTVWHPIGM